MGQPSSAWRQRSSASAGTVSTLTVETPSLTSNISRHVLSQAPTPAQRFVSTLACTTYCLLQNRSLTDAVRHNPAKAALSAFAGNTETLTEPAIQLLGDVLEPLVPL